MTNLFPSDTDATWESFGTRDPYFGVLSEERFRTKNLSPAATQAFFDSGELHVQTLLGLIRSHLRPDFQPKHVLDFGCGVGRIVIPVAKMGAFVVGLDVSPSMLRECRSNCGTRGVLDQVDLRLVQDELDKNAQFDWVHSYVVLQHVKTTEGMRLVKQLAKATAPGGIVSIQIPVRRDVGRLRFAVSWLLDHIPLAFIVANIIERKPALEPRAQMNMYDLHHVLTMLAPDVGSAIVLHPTRHFTTMGYVIMFVRAVN